MNKWIPSAMAGFGGGLAPFAINLAQALVGNSQLTIKPSVGYIIGMLIFGIIGGVVAALFREVDLRKAFFLGISAPAMISLAAKSDSGASKANSTALTPSSGAHVSFSLVSSAYAQQESRSSPQPIDGRILDVQLNGTMPAATIAFRDASNKEVKTVTITLHEDQRILVPQTATSIVVRYGDSVTNAYPLSPSANQPQRIEVTGTQGRKDLDIFSAFTGQPKILYNIQIAERSTAP
jgi:hypothetical protein